MAKEYSASQPRDRAWQPCAYLAVRGITCLQALYMSVWKALRSLHFAIRSNVEGPAVPSCPCPDSQLFVSCFPSSCLINGLIITVIIHDSPSMGDMERSLYKFIGS